MTIGRREFLTGAGALAVSARSVFAGLQTARPGAIFPPSVRADFPSVALNTYMNSAALHPLGTFAARAIEQGMAFRLHGPGEGRVDFGADKQQDLKKRYGQLIGATANEIAYRQHVRRRKHRRHGLDLPRRGGNVIDELHFTTSLYMQELEKKASSFIVKHRNWAIDVNDMDRAIDKNTQLVSLALVSNVNGFMRREIRQRARPRAAHVFADIIQAAGICRSTCVLSASTSRQPAPTSG
jgi:selenocysteine lyase/cysteine desulfurase